MSSLSLSIFAISVVAVLSDGEQVPLSFKGHQFPTTTHVVPVLCTVVGGAAAVAKVG